MWLFCSLSRNNHPLTFAHIFIFSAFCLLFLVSGHLESIPREIRRQIRQVSRPYLLPT